MAPGTGLDQMGPAFQLRSRLVGSNPAHLPCVPDLRWSVPPLPGCIDTDGRHQALDVNMLGENMANPGDLALLRDGGVDQWNAWRRQNPGTVPNLVHADRSEKRRGG